MSNWGIASGIGQGIMQGLNFNRQLDADKRSQQALDNQTEVLGMQRDLHREKMGAINRENAEVQRKETLGTLKTGIDANYQDRPDYERAEMYRKYGSEMGVFKPEDLDAATKARDGLIQMAGPEAYQALLRGNSAPIGKLLGARGYGFQDDKKTGKYLITPPGASSSESIDKDGVLQLDVMATYRDKQAAKEKEKLEADYKRAQINNLDSRTALNGRLPHDRAGGAGSGSGKGDKGDKPFSLDIGDIEKFAPIDPTTGKPDPQKVINIAATGESILNLNPGVKDVTPHVAYQVGAMIERGDIKPEAIHDPATNTYFKGVKYGSRAIRVGDSADIDPDVFYSDKGAVGNARLEMDRQWLPQYLKSMPDSGQRAKLELAISSETPEGKKYRNEIIQGYEKLRASGVDMNTPAALSVRQAYSALQTADRIKAAPPVTQSAKKDAKPELTPEEKALAASMGLNEPGLLDRAANAGNRFLNRAKGVVAGANGDQFEARIKIAQRMPGMEENKRQLLEMARGNPERMARLKQVFAAQQ